MSKINRSELYKLSDQMVQLFVQDIFSKNKTDLEKAKSNMTDEQRESLKESLKNLQAQVDSFINDQNSSKTITENNKKKNTEPLSPLREKLRKKIDAKTNKKLEEENEE